MAAATRLTSRRPPSFNNSNMTQNDSGLTLVLGAMGVNEESAHAFAARLFREALAATPEEDLQVVNVEAVPAATMETAGDWGGRHRLYPHLLKLHWLRARRRPRHGGSDPPHGQEVAILQQQQHGTRFGLDLRAWGHGRDGGNRARTGAAGTMGVNEESAHAFAARLFREALAATPEQDLQVVNMEAVPAASMETGDGEVTLAEWEIRRRSLREVGVHFARKIARHKASAEDIAALSAIMAAPAGDWSATIAEMAPRIGTLEDESRCRSRQCRPPT
ncbi:hypothetical protein HDU86_003514 [Geranomyces michiganensis]|nr:hypothetical protein HDU86_003514 [Geranomyces michiganensis]